MGLGLRDLRIWQESVALSADVVRTTAAKARRESRVILERVQTTSMRVAEFIAQGYGRYVPAEQRTLYRAAKRELLALETQLAVLRQSDLLSVTHHAELSSRIQTVNRLLSGFLVYLDRQTEAQ